MSNLGKRRLRFKRGFMALLALSLLAGACGSGESEEGGEVDAGGTTEDSAEAEPTAESSDAQESEGEAAPADYPSKSIRWIIPFDPGGGSDTDFRRLQPHLEEILGVTIEPEYLTGASGGIGWTELVNAEPDGYTVGSIVLPHIILQPQFNEDAGFQTDQFSFVALNARAPQALIVSAENPAYENFEEFVEDVEANPGGVDLGGDARFDWGHGVQALLAEQGIETNFVFGAQSAASVTAGVLGGHYPIGITSAQQPALSDEIRAIAVSSEERFEPLPDVPTLKELGYDIVGASNWGVAAPEGTPLELRQVIADAIAEAMEREEVQANLADSGQVAVGIGPEETQEYVDEFSSQLDEVIRVFEEEA